MTTFSSGISSLNGLTVQTQYLAIGTSGNDFNIDSTTDIHTFNLPTASALNRGALESGDWMDFDAKQDQITLTTTGTGAATLITNTLNIPTPSDKIIIGTTVIDSGTTRRLLFQDGTIVSESANLVFDASNQLIIGTYTNPNTKLSVDNGANNGAYLGGLKGLIAVGNASGTAYGIDALGRSTASGGTSYGVYAIADGSTGNAVNYGVRGQASGAGLTNYAGYFDALSGTTNYALYVQRGDMQFGVSPTLNKIGFFNATPIVQPTAVTTPQGIANALTSLGLLASSTIPTEPAGWTTIVKSANQDVTNSATLVDDTDLQFSVVAGGHYMIEMDICWSGNNTTGDYSFTFGVNSGLVKGGGVVYANDAAGTLLMNTAAGGATTPSPRTVQVITADLDYLMTLKICFNCTASANATFSYKFANTAAAAGRTSRTWKGSILRNIIKQRNKINIDKRN
jgi:hypothetical protein